MTEETLKSIQINYEILKKRKDAVIELLAKIQELNKDESVKKYLNLLDELASIDYIGILNRSDEDMLGISFRTHMHLINETNEIYLCLGTYMLDRVNNSIHIPSDIRLNNDDPRVEYKIYINIENKIRIRIPIDECEKFESTHKIIFSDQLQTHKVYDNIQTEFIKTAIKEGQKEACDKVLSKKW